MRKTTPAGLIGRLFLLIAALLFISLHGASVAKAQDGAADWSGQWDTTWRDGGGRLILEQDGPAVTGIYPLYDGRIEAVAEGRTLRGRWFEDDDSGNFELVQSRDGRTFAGRFDAAEWWTGARAIESGLIFDTDQSSPMAVMRSFLAAANGAVDGDFDALRFALTLILPADGQNGVNDRFDQARRLFEVIDLTTLSLWNLPRGADDGPEGDTARAVLEQAGTDVEVTVDFRRVDGEWFLAPAPVAGLVAQLDRLRDARAAALADAGPLSATLSTPRDVMRTFLLSFRHNPDGSAPETLATLDLRGRPEVTRAHDGQVLAGYLKRVIDRAGYVIWQEIPDDPLSQTAYVHFQHPDGSIAIAPVETGEGLRWMFTPATLGTIRAVYAAIEDTPVVAGLTAPPDPDIHFTIRNALRSVMPSALSPLGPFETWQWAALAAAFLLALAAAWAATRLTRAGAGFFRSAAEAPAPNATATWAVRALVVGLVLLGASWLLGLPDRFTAILATLLVVLGLFLLLWIGIGRGVAHYRSEDRITGHNVILLSLASGVLRAALIVTAIFALAHALSWPITGVLAGFGIGGLAVALAAQPTLQNLLSGFTLYADRPLSVGDFCRFGDKMGTVEEIGLRSTRLRTLDRTVISMPNSQFLDLQLENYGLRDRFLFTTTLNLRYETTPDQMRYVLAELRKLLIAHPKVLSDPLRVRFAVLGAHSLDVEVFSYVLAADMDEFAAIREDLLLRIMAAVEDAGTQFAFPSVVHYAAEDKGLEPDRVARSEAAVREWRDAEDLPFPDFDWRSRAELSGTLDYPPEGSVLRREGETG